MESSSLTTRQQAVASLQLPLVQYLLMFLVVLCVYRPTFWYTYVWDDFTMITQNDAIKHWKNIPSFFTDPNTFTDDPSHRYIDAWRPLRNIYYLITYKLHGLHPAGWHFHHVLLHSLVSSLLLVLFHGLYRFGMAWSRHEFLPTSVQAASWFAVFMWAVHPVNTEVTAWLKSADDLLACLFGVAALIVLFPADHRLTIKRALLSGVFFALALLSKESIPPIAAIYPMLVLILAPTRLRAVKNPVFLFAVGIFFLQTIGYVVLRKILLGKLEQVSYLAGNFSLMMATMTTASVRYLRLVFWPFPPTVQVGDYAGWPIARHWNDPSVIVSICILLAVFAVAFSIARRSKFVVAGILFALLAFLPAANLIPMMQILAERFVYFPAMGIALAISGSLAYLFGRSILTTAFLSLGLSAALAVTTIVRLPVWSDNASFQFAEFETYQISPRTQYNRALLMANSGNTTKALAICLQVRKELPHVIGPGMVACLLLDEIGKETSATELLEELARRFPDSARPLAMQADRARLDGDLKTASEKYAKALSLEPELAGIWYYYGETNYYLRNYELARSALKKTLQIESRITSATILINLMDEQAGLGITQ